VAAASLIATTQALRLHQRESMSLGIGAPVVQFMAEIGELVPFIGDDMPLDGVLEKLCVAIEGRDFALYRDETP